MYPKITCKRELLTIKLSSHLPKQPWKAPESAQAQVRWSPSCAAHQAATAANAASERSADVYSGRGAGFFLIFTDTQGSLLGNAFS